MASTASAARAQGACPARSNELHANKILHKIYITYFSISFVAKGDADKTGRTSITHRHRDTNINTQRQTPNLAHYGRGLLVSWYSPFITCFFLSFFRVFFLADFLQISGFRPTARSFI